VSLNLSLKQAPAATLDLLVERPELAVVFWMDPDYRPPEQPAWVRWLAVKLGGYTPPMELPEAPPELNRDGETLRIESHASELFAASRDYGRPIPGSTHGHGDDRAVWPDHVARLREAAQAAVDDGRAPHFQSLHKFIESTTTGALGLVLKLS